MALKNNIERVRINGFLPKSLVDDIDSLSSEYGLTRFSMMTVILKQYFEGKESQKVIGMANDVLNKSVAITNNLDLYEVTDEGKQAFHNLDEFVNAQVVPSSDSELDVIDKSDFLD